VGSEQQPEERRILHGEGVDGRQDPLFGQVDEQVAGLVPVAGVVEDEPYSVDRQLVAR
jgi:hypothetical protein